MFAGLAWYPISWVLIYLTTLASMAAHSDELIGAVFYFSGSLPAIAAIIFLTGYFTLLFDR